MGTLDTRPVTLPSLHPFSGKDVWELLEDRAATDGDRTFLIWQPFDGQARSWTYAQFRAEALSVAAGLQGWGIRAGDRLVLHLENCPEFLLTWFGCAALHAIAVTTNARSTADELAHFVADSGAAAIVTQPKFVDMCVRAAPALSFVATTDEDPGLDRSGHHADGDRGAIPFSSLMGDATSVRRPAADPAAGLSIQYTSGTTSRPKGVLWSHANGLWAARVNAVHEGLRRDDCHLAYMPLFHTNALAYSVLPTLWACGRVVLIHKWSTSRFWDISLTHRCTWLSLMPLSARALLSMDAPAEHHYRVVGGFSGQVWRTRFGVDSIAWWGMTETVSQGILTDGSPSEIEGNIGRPAPEYDIAVVDADGAPVRPGQTGALVIRGVRGLSLFVGYWRNSRADEESFDADGWLSTGDLVRLNADGTLSFVDRAKDMLRVGVENVAALEVERAVGTTAGVGEVSVVGRPDETLDEVPVAFVVPTADADDTTLPDRVVATCRELVAAFKVPRAVIIVKALPHSTISKVDKVELRRALAAPDRLAEFESEWVVALASDPSGDAL